MRANPGNVRLVFRHHPLSFHKDAHLAHQASLAARAQGKFWEYHDLLFQNQRKLKKKDLISYAKKLKLDVKKFQEALDKKTHAKEIDEELDYGKELKVPGTPTTYVNGRQVNIGKGKKPKEVLEELVKDELERVKELQKKGLKGNKLYYELVGQPDDSSDKKDSKSKKQKEYKYIAIGDSPTKGDDDAQVTLVEFSDFTCGFCSGAAKTLGQIARAYKGKVQIVFKNFPLSQGNYDIAQAALAAHQQGKFWEYHDLVFNNQSKVDRDSLIAHAKSLELDVELFKRTMDSPATKAHVDADVKQGRELKLQGTPSFFLNNRPLGALQGFDSFMKELNKELIKKGYKKEDLPSGPPPAVIAMGDSPYKGLKNAPVSIVEFSDFQ